MSQDTADLFSWLFGDGWISPIGDVLSSTPGTQKLNGRCKHCGGQLWQYDNDVVCEECSTVIGGDEHPVDLEDPWVVFRRNRRELDWNRKRCVGGFPHAYSWNAANEEEPVEFYE